MSPTKAQHSQALPSVQLSCWEQLPFPVLFTDTFCSFVLHFHALLLAILLFNMTLRHSPEVLVRVSKSKEGVFKQKHILFSRV